MPPEGFEFDVSDLDDAEPAKAEVECQSCGEGSPKGECSKSMNPCGHHCNHSWSHDACCNCGTVWHGDRPVAPTPKPRSRAKRRR